MIELLQQEILLMSAATFDTHKFVKTLEAAGVPALQAEAIPMR